MTPEEKEKYILDNKDKLSEELSLSKIDIIQCNAIRFLAADIFKKDPMFRSNLPIPTAAANGKDIVIDPEFWSKLNRKQKLRALYHEGFHNLMGHCDRKVNTKAEHMIWNIAVDCVTEGLASACDVGEGKYAEGTINPSKNGTVNLEINGKKLLISGCHEKSAEQIYDILMKHIEQNPSPKGNEGEPVILGEDGKVIKPLDNHELSECTPEEKADREQRLRQALVEHKLRGTMPGPLADMIEEMLKPRVNWRAELREMILPLIKTYQSYKRPNRRSEGSGYMRPSMVKEGVNAFIALDTSGSIGKDELNYFTGEMHSIFKQFDPGSITAKLMLHTTGVYETVDIVDVKDLDNIQTQTGGTDHCDVFEKAEEEDAQVLICFTDGYSGFPESTKINKVLWIVTNEQGMEQIPDNLGKKIFVDIKEFNE